MRRALEGIERWISPENMPALASSLPFLRTVLVWVATAVAVSTGLLAAQLLIGARPFIGGIDFYYYVVIARDLAGGVPDVSLIRYVYFPGIYSFWEFVFRVSDGSLASLQWAYVAVLFANAALVGMILSTLTGIWPAGVLALSIYLFEASRIEGFTGCTEPITTLAFLMGLWLWIVLDRQGRVRAGLMALAAGFGLALYVKQQGGLLAFGALGLLPALWNADSPGRYRLSQLLILPIGAGGVFLSAMLLEGGGLAAVATGLRAAQDYQAQGSWIEHVTRVYGATQPIANFFLSGCVLWTVMTVARSRTSSAADPVMLSLGLSVLSTLGGLLQFSKRGYLHYAMLLLPSAILTAGLATYLVSEWLGRYAQRAASLAAPVVAGGMVAFVLINSTGVTRFVDEASAQLASPKRWTTQEEALAVAPLCSALTPGSSLLVIPPRDNSVHWFCRTKPADLKFRNAWDPADPGRYIPLLSAPSLGSVFILSGDKGEYEQRYFQQGDWSLFFHEMDRLGFRQTTVVKEGRLFQRTLP